MEKDEQLLRNIRHSLAHILAMAVLEKDPEAKLAIGPVVDNGFYYDFEFSKDFSLSDKDIKGIEKRMRKLVSSGIDFIEKEVVKKRAQGLWKNQPYKLELIEEILKRDEPINTYTSGTFTDLCQGGHVENTKEIDPRGFKLDRVAGAYWKGDEKNTMLTRIYGLAFLTKEDLDAYLQLQEEAKKRDHRKLGKELDLFTFSPLVGSGLPLWTPKGTILREELDSFVWSLRKERGYQKVTIPHITKKDLYEKSGHWDKFSDELFRITTREGKEYAMKPMNCPHHTQIFSHIKRNYREMPQRYSETTMVYRDEQSGELGGLTRVLSITQDDAHVFCRESQVKEEIYSIWDIIDTFYSTFDFKFDKVRLSFHDPEKFEAYLGTKEVWKKSEDMLKQLAEERGAEYYIAPGEAAMYGPKLDFVAKDSLGREHQVATIQLDMNLPEKFDLTCVNEKNEDERVVMIHAAIMGSIERFTAVLIEHLAGVFPLWLSPVQIKVLPISESQNEYAQEVYETLKKSDFRVEIDKENDTLGKKIRRCKLEKIPYFLVIGDKEIESKTVTIESRKNGNEGDMSVEKLIEKLNLEIKEKK